jgi:O-antigen ligase
MLYVFLAISVVSALLSHDLRHGLLITTYTAFVIAIALAVAQIAPRIKAKLLLLALIVPATVACAFGFYQFAGDLMGLPLDVTGLRAPYSGQVFGFPRIQAMSLEPLYFANYLLLPISVLIGIGALVRGSWVLGVLFVTALLLTLSRGGVGALLVVSVLWIGLLLSKHMVRRSAVVAGVGVLGVALTILALVVGVPLLKRTPAPKPALASYTDQVTSYEVGNKTVDRAYTRRIALQAFAEHPLLGVGPGNYGRYIHGINPKYPQTQIANNEPAELLAETGAAGLLTLLIFAGLLAWRAFGRLRKQTMKQAALGWGVLFYLVGVAIQYYSFSTLYVVHIWVAIGLLLGLAYAAASPKTSAV